MTVAHVGELVTRHFDIALAQLESRLALASLVTAGGGRMLLRRLVGERRPVSQAVGARRGGGHAVRPGSGGSVRSSGAPPQGGRARTVRTGPVMPGGRSSSSSFRASITLVVDATRLVNSDVCERSPGARRRPESLHDAQRAAGENRAASEYHPVTGAPTPASGALVRCSSPRWVRPSPPLDCSGWGGHAAVGRPAEAHPAALFMVAGRRSRGTYTTWR